MCSIFGGKRNTAMSNGSVTEVMWSPKKIKEKVNVDTEEHRRFDPGREPTDRNARKPGQTQRFKCDFSPDNTDNNDMEHRYVIMFSKLTNSEK